jgi:hypothetical protein
LAIGTFPDATASFEVGLPLSIVGLTVAPLKLPSSLSLTGYEITEIKGFVRKLFITQALSLSFLEVSLENLSIVVEDDPSSFELFAFLVYLSKICAVFEGTALEG